jgi:glycosyltransferase involved in cell wall biosynthesis
VRGINSTEKRLNVCMVTSSFPRSKSDHAGIFIYDLARHLVRKGVKIDVIAPHDCHCPRHESLDDIRIHRFPYFFPLRYQRLCYGAGILKNLRAKPPLFVQLPFFLFSETIFTSIWSRKIKPDLFHSHWIFPQGLTGAFLSRMQAIPHITSIHGSDVHGLNHPAMNYLHSLVVRHSAACTVNSRTTAERAQKFSGEKRTLLIPMGVDIDIFKPIPHGDFLWRGSKKDCGKVILYVGRLIDVKGVEYLVRAFPGVWKRNRDAELLIIGNGPKKKELKNLADKLEIGHRVHFIGGVPHQELPRYYSLASVFVLPSVVTEAGEKEGLGVVLLEAMACGTPVIGTRVGGIPDTIRDGETGLLVKEKDPEDLASKINRVLMDEDLRRGLVKRGKSFVGSNFSWEIVAEEFLGLYTEVLDAVRSKASKEVRS